MPSRTDPVRSRGLSSGMSSAILGHTPFPTLRPGDTVALVAPAGPVASSDIEASRDFVEQRGYRCRVSANCSMAHGHLAGTDAQRREDLEAAFRDPQVRAIFCLRGGYGSARLLPRLHRGLLLLHPKPLIGYSDITALHAWLGNQGMVGFHAPMLASDLLQADRGAEADALFSLLADGLREGHIIDGGTGEPNSLHLSGQASGRLVGGNLSVFASLLGTPWQVRADNSVLFLEDVGEPPYRVDRLLWQLREAGVLAAARGFVLGSFSGAGDCTAVLAEMLMPLGKPIVSGWPAGHGAPHFALPLGARVLLDTDLRELRLLQDVMLPQHERLDLTL